jgi:hypothetical protein
MSEQPDFIIIGAQARNDCVVVIASRDLYDAEITRECEYEERFFAFGPPAPPRSEVVTFTARSRTYVMVYAPTYREAMTKLMEDWSPDAGPTEHAEITPARPALPGGGA